MEEKEPIISKCGYKCDRCPAHKSNRKSEDDKKIMCDAWNKYLGSSIEPEAISACRGCQAEGDQGNKTCSVRPCATAKGMENCAHCGEFACEKVKGRMNFVGESVKDVSSISEPDFKKFVEPFLGGRYLNEIRKALKKL